MYYELTHPQMGIWEMQKFHEGSPIANIGGTMLLSKELDFKLLDKTLNKFIEKNDSIRIKLKDIDGRTVQFISEYTYRKLHFIDFLGRTKEEMDSWVNKMMQTPFKLYESELFEFVMIRSWDGECGYYIKFHHIIADTWSIALLVTQTMKFYNDMKTGEEKEEIIPSYISYIESEQAYLESPKFHKDREYWLDKFKEKPSLTALKVRDAAMYSSRANRSTYTILGDAAEGISRYCKEHKLSPAILFEAAVCIYIDRILDTQKITIGTPVLNRSGKEKAATGMYVSTVPMTVSIDQNISFIDLCKQIGKEHKEVFRHQKYPYETLLREVRKLHGITNNLYDISVSYQNAKVIKPSDDYVVSTNWYFNGNLNESLSLNIDDRDDKGVLVLHFDYLEELFNEAEIEELYKRLVIILKQGIENSEKRYCDLELVDKEEKHVLLHEFNDTYADYPRDKTIHQLFEEQAQKTPDAVALVFEDKEMTYRQLNERANQLARVLRNKGVGPDIIVGLMLHRSFEMIIGILGVLKAGGAYMPIDSEYPEDRIKFMLEESNAKVLLSSSSLEDKTMSFADCIYLDNKDYGDIDRSNLEFINGISDLVYVIYTSGSTGKPKGAMITHGGLVNYIVWAKKVYLKNEKLNFPLFTSIAFDLTVTSIFTPLISGSSIVIYNSDNVKVLLENIINEGKVGIVKLTPAHLSLLENIDLTNTKVKGMILGGEDLKTELARKISKRFNHNIEIFNEYGPTETVVGCMIYKFDHVKDENISVPIGVPADNVKIYILDRFLNPVPKSMVGEMYISGDGVAKGYLNRPELTKERFLMNPFVDGERMYKTGDLARWLPDGNISYLGRSDNQVKIRGLRIELTEIERVIEEYEGIEQVFVTVVEDHQRKALCAYYVSDKDIDTDLLNEQICKSLPHYMIPQYSIKLDEMPLTTNGKVDKKSLPDPKTICNVERKIVLPSTETEQYLSRIFCKVLEIDNIGITENLFDLGLDSLKIIRVQSELLKNKVELYAQVFYKNSTIQGLASIIEAGNMHLYDYDEIELENYNRRFPKHNEWTRLPKITYYNKVLIFGATGFLGIHILNNMVRTTKAQLTCIVRGKDDFEAFERLEKCWASYFDEEYPKGRIKIYAGDISQRDFKLDKSISHILGTSCDTILNAAADVRFYGNYDDYKVVNTDGVKNICDFALSYGLPVHHISTISVSGEYGEQKQKNPIFTENDLYIGQNYKRQAYIRSKFEAEQVVIDYIDKGLKANIYRVGRLTGRYTDGKFQRNIEENNYYNILRFFLTFGICTEGILNEPLEMSPVEYSAKAIAGLMHYGAVNKAFHVINPKEIIMRDLFSRLAEMGYPIRVLENDKFSAEIEGIELESGEEHLLKGIINEVDAKKGLTIKRGINLRSDITQRYLDNINFTWPEISKEYIIKIVEDMKKRNFIDTFNSAV